MNASERREEPTQTPIPGMWPHTPHILGDGPGNVRGRALSLEWASVVTETVSDVNVFRMEHLHGRLLPAEGVHDWIGTQSAADSRDGPRVSRWLFGVAEDDLIAVADGSRIIPAAVMQRIAQGHSGGDDYTPHTRLCTLLYATPQRTEAFIAIRAHGVLAELRRTALATLDYMTPASSATRLWGEAVATTFILTGYVPLIDEGLFPPPARPGRRQTEKHLQLAAFTAFYEVEGRSLAERLALWNREYPQWSYKNTTNFGWDSREAVRRLMRHIGPNGAEAEEEKPEPWYARY